MHSTRPTQDSDVQIQLQTPRGLSVNFDAEQVPMAVYQHLSKETVQGDSYAAIAMAQLTGLTVTIKRTTQTTVRAEDLDK